MDVRAYLELLRPPLAPMDLALPAASALLSAYATTGLLPGAEPFLIATIGAYFAITSSYVFNDYVDVDVDRVAMPDRPLPSAKVSRRGAGIYALVLLMLAAAAATYLNPESLVMLIAATAIITVYSAWAKRRTPLSWMFVGLAYGMVPVGVWLAISPAGYLMPGPGFHPAALILGLMICITDWGFTNCDASRDVPGDRAKGIPTTLPLTGFHSHRSWWQPSDYRCDPVAAARNLIRPRRSLSCDCYSLRHMDAHAVRGFRQESNTIARRDALLPGRKLQGSALRSPDARCVSWSDDLMPDEGRQR